MTPSVGVAFAAGLVACGGASGGGERTTCGFAESWDDYQDWERESSSPTPIEVDSIDDAIDVAVGAITCVVRATGDLLCWDDPARPFAIAAPAPVSTVAVGIEATCFTAGSEVRCFHHHAVDGVAPTDIAPVRVVGGAGANTPLCVETGVIDAGWALGYSRHPATACARTVEGDPVCWTVEAEGRSTLTSVIRHRPDVELDLGVAVIDDDDLVRGFGPDDRAPAPATTCFGPPPLSQVPGAIAVAEAGSHSCALTRDGVVSCWGDNEHGELGDGTRAARRSPAPVPGLAPALRISVGDRRTCAVLRTGAIACWGIGVRSFYRPERGTIRI